MADINAYALGLELQLQINPALKALDTISDAIKGVQKMLSDASSAFKIGGDAGIEKQVTGLTAVKNEVGVVYAAMLKSYEDAENAAKRMNSSLIMNEDELNRQSQAVEKATLKFHKYEQQFLKLLEHNTKFKPELKREIEQFEKLGDNMDDLQRFTNLSTKKMQEQKVALTSLVGTLSVFGDSANFILQVGSALVGKYGAVGAALVIFGNTLHEIIQMQDVYSKVSFRAIDTQEGLMVATSRLRQVTAATNKEAIQTFTALSKAGFRAGDSISKLAEDNIKFYQATGISQDQTAAYQRQIVLLMGSAEVAGKNLAALSAIMRQTGLSADDAQQHIGTLADAARGLGLVMKPEELDDYTQTLTKFAAAAGKVAGPQAMKDITSFFIGISKNTIRSAKEWTFLTGSFATNRKANVLLRDAMHNLHSTVAQLFAQGEEFAPIMAEQMGLTLEQANAMKLLDRQVELSGLGIDEYIAKMGAGADLNRDAAESLRTLQGEFQKIIEPIKAWVTEFIAAHPVITQVVMILGSAALVAGLVAFAFKSLVGAIGSFTNIVSKSIEMTGKFTGWLTNMGSAAKTTNQATGSGVRAFMTEVAGGLKAFADPKAILGLAVVAGFAIVMTGVVVGVAAAVKELGLTAEDLSKAAFAMLIGVGVLGVAIGLLSLVGAEAIAAAPLLWPLAAVMIALGAAILLAGLGVKFAGEAFEKLFTIVINNAFTFLMVVGAMVLALPALSFGLGLFATALAFTAPVILFGMGELFGAALLGMFVAPVFERLAGSFAMIGTALAGIGPRAGVALISLAVGMLAFMAALTGTAVVGAITGFFGLTKDPMVQAKKIADAITMISSPAVSLASALLKVKNVGDAFSPIIDSVLGRKAELEAAVATLVKLNSKMLAIDKTIKETGFTPAISGAVPIRQPLITDDTARRVHEQRNQAQMIDNTKGMKTSIDKIGEKLTSSSNMRDLIDLLRVWLPKIAQADKDEGLGSTVNQWM